MKKINSGKQQRLKLQVARATDRSTAKKLTGQNVTVEQQAAHDFRLKGQAKDLFTVFHVREAGFEVEKRIIDSRQPLDRQSLMTVEASPLYAELIDIPVRPPWKRGMKAAKLQQNEEQLFEEYLDRIYQQFPPHRLNHFEHNLQVWRQLWRVCEMSDVLIISTDARHPMFHFPPSLHRYVTVTLGKPMILVLNKIDLIDQRTLDGWLEWFEVQYPKLTVVQFTSFPHPNTIVSDEVDISKKRKDRKRDGKKMTASGVSELMRVLDSLLIVKLEKQKQQSDEITEEKEDDETATVSEAKEGDDDEAEESNTELGLDDLVTLRQPTATQAINRPAREQILIVGTIGHPNAGKSSLINALFGRPVVSVSETPGHTKHLQSLALTTNIAVVDCPGLVFPAVDMPRPLQVLGGIFPISQLREPFSSIKYLAERVPLESIYGLKHVNGDGARVDDNDDSDIVSVMALKAVDDAALGQWSAWSICESYAAQRSYTIKGSNGRLDTNRAANEILHDAMHGNVVLNFRAPALGASERMSAVSQPQSSG